MPGSKGKALLIGLMSLAAVIWVGSKAANAVSDLAAQDQASSSNASTDPSWRNARVEELAQTPSSVLYAQHLRGASTRYDSLSSVQRDALAAAWIRYQSDTYAFNKLQMEQQLYFQAAFDSFLLHDGSPDALVLRGDLYAHGLAGSYDVRLAESKWREGLALAPESKALQGKVGSRGP